MQENRIRIDFGWKSFISFFGISGLAGADLWKNLKKIYFENPPILCSIATAGPENAKNRIRIDFGWKSFLSFFGSRPQAQTCKKFWKNIFWKSTNFMFICKSRPWKCKRTAFESILAEKVSFHFLAQAAGTDLWKVLKKIYFENHKFYVHLQKQALKMQTNSIRINFGWKSFISFFGLRPQARTCEKVLKKIYFENPPILCSIATAGHENAREQNSNRFWLKKFPFIFWLKATGDGPVKSSEKNIFWKSTNFMFISNSRPWKCKRTELESILVEKVSFHFLAQGSRRGPVKSSEKNIFWKSTNVMFNCKSRPCKCKRTALIDFGEKVSFLYLEAAKKLWKKYIWKSTNFMFICKSRPWKFESILAEKASFHFLALGRRRGHVKQSLQFYVQ